MKVFDGFTSPRWSEAEPGVGRKKMRGPRRGPTKTPEMLNGPGSGLGFGMFAPFGDGLFFGGVCPQVPLHLRRGGHLGLFKVWPLRGRLAPNISGAA
jgi:hypothetical protein